MLVRRGPCCSCTHRFLILAIVQEFQNHVVKLDEADVQALLSVTKIGNSVGRRIDFLLVSFDLVIQHQSVLNFFAMEVPVAHHLGAAQHICVERIRPVHILDRQSKVLKTEDTLPERCVVACCHSYYSFSTSFWAQMKFAPHQGEIAARPTSLMKSRRVMREHCSFWAFSVFRLWLWL